MNRAVFEKIDRDDIIFTPLGGASEVGATSHYILWKDVKIIVDSGRRQNGKYISPEYDEVSRDIDLFFITHVHGDHIGTVMEAFDYFNIDKIICTYETRAVLPIVVKDTRKILLNNKKNCNPYIEKIYSDENISKLINKITVIDYNTCFFYSKVTFTLLNTSHLIGSAGILFEDETYRLFLTSDFTESRKFFHPETNFDIVYKKKIDTMITESTYGGVTDSSEILKESSLSNLTVYINKIFNSTDSEGNFLGGNVLIPAFAAGRTQEVIIALLILIKKNKIPLNTKIRVPFNIKSKIKNLSYSFTEMYYSSYRSIIEKELDCNLPENFTTFIKKYLLPINLHTDYNDLFSSKNNIVISTPGMLGVYRTHGESKILGAIKVALDFISSENNGIIFVGYMAPGTLGHVIQDSLPGEQFQYYSHHFTRRTKHIYKVSFPGHVSAKGFMNLVEDVKPSNLIITHGDLKSSLNFSETVTDRGINLLIPDIEEPIYLMDNGVPSFFSSHHKYSNIILSIELLGVDLNEVAKGVINNPYFNDLRILKAINHILKDKPNESHIDIITSKNTADLIFYNKLKNEVSTHFNFSMDIIVIDQNTKDKDYYFREVLEFISEKALGFKEKFDIYLLSASFLVFYPILIISQFLNNKIFQITNRVVELPLLPVDLDLRNIETIMRNKFKGDSIYSEMGHHQQTESDFYELIQRIINYKKIKINGKSKKILPNQFPVYDKSSIFFEKDIFSSTNNSLWGEIENIYDVKNNKAVEILNYIANKLLYNIKKITFTNFIRNYNNHHLIGEVIGFDKDNIFYRMNLENGIQFITINLVFGSNAEALVENLGECFE